MTTIVTRGGKGSALTHNEMDTNLTNLNNDKLEATTTATLANKSIDLGSNTLTGTKAQFDSACSDGNFVYTDAVGTMAAQNATSVNIDGGTIDGTTIGGSSAAAGTFTSLSDSGNLTFTGTGNRITGDFSNATIANRVMFQTSTVNGNTLIGAIPNGTATGCQFLAYNSSDPANSAAAQIISNSAEVSFRALTSGTGAVHPMTFHTGGSERMRIDTSGTLILADTNSNGIQFPATAIANANANNLDDYEEGSWTPAFSATSASFSYSIQVGRYTKIGNTVHCQCYVLLAASGNVLSANTLKISGLPFTTSSTSNNYSSCSINYWQGLGTSVVYLSGTGDINATTLSLFKITAAAAASVSMVANDLSATAQSGMMISLTYKV